jgi:hypothetical protein
MPLYRDYVYTYLVNSVGNPEPIREVRQRILPLARGTVLEIGVGSAVNFAYHDPSKVTKLYALEPNARMIRLNATPIFPLTPGSTVEPLAFLPRFALLAEANVNRAQLKVRPRVGGLNLFGVLELQLCSFQLPGRKQPLPSASSASTHCHRLAKPHT